MKYFLSLWIIFIFQTVFAGRTVQIRWQSLPSGNKILFTGDPIAALSWSVTDDNRRSVKYRLKISPDTTGIDDSSTQTLETFEFNAKVHLNGAGKFIAFLQALDATGKVVANSEVFPFEMQKVQPVASLGAPEILGESVLTANEEGNLEVPWSSVPGAHSYSIRLKNFEGHLLKTYSTAAGPESSQGKFLIANMMPGRYQVQVSALDKQGLMGPTSELKYINVPAATTLVAPQNFQVKMGSGSESTNGSRRSAQAQWDVVEGAKSFEVEVARDGGAIQVLKAPENNLKLDLELAQFSLRVRAVDARGIRTNWSSPQKINLQFEAVVKLLPENKKIQNSSSSAEEPTQFQWKAQPGTLSYLFEIQSQDQTYKDSVIVTGESVQKNLPVGKIYTWSVRPSGESVPADSAPFLLTVMGKALEKPEIEIPANSFVRDLEWRASPFAESYRFLLQRQNRKLNKWENVLSQDQHKDNSVAFDGKLPGGYYRLLVVAKAPLRISSPTAVVSFNVKNGDRSPAAEETFEVRQSIDRISGWFSSASYLATVFDYRSTNFDRSNSSLSYSAVGATGRIGLGYFQSPSAWGFHGIYDLSGISLEGKTTTFSSLEMNAVHRRSWGRFGEIRNNLGIYYKELPETVGFASTQSISTDLVKVLGPHYGFEYWRALDSQFGVQVNAHVYLPMMKMKTPNDQEIVMTPSWQLGLLGSYRWQRNLTALLGYAYRIDQIKYKAMAGAVNGTTNSLSMAGHYINMYLEWDM